MRLEEDVLGRVQDMIDAIQAVEAIVEGMDEASFLAERRSRDAVLWNLTVLGEAVRGVPADVQAAHPEIPWARMRGLRNLLVHEYFGIDDPHARSLPMPPTPASRPLDERAVATGGSSANQGVGSTV